jgi:simple sugar transport system permease protein
MGIEGASRRGFWSRLAARKSFWPCVALASLLLFNVFFTKGFHKTRLQPDPRNSVAVRVGADIETATSWEATAPEAGSYDVMLIYCCDEHRAGREHALAVGPTRFGWRTVKTASWDTPAERVVGSVRIETPGAVTVTLAPLDPGIQSRVRLEAVWLVGKWRLFGSMIDILHRGSIVMLLSIGMTLVIATAGIDLSVGSVMGIAGAIAGMILRQETNGPVWAAIVLPLAAALAAGLWNGVLVAFVRLQPIIATLILLVAGRGIAQLVTEGQIPTFERPGFEYLGTGAFLALPFTISVVAIVAALTLAVTKLTVAGLCIEAVGNNERASRLAGLRPWLVKLLVYAFSGLCAGVAGLIATADIKAADVNNCGLYLELDAILAVVIGGTPFSGGRANVLGSLVGALVMQTLTTMILTRGVAPEQAFVVKALVVVAVCLLQSEKVRSAVTRRLRRREAAP